MLIPKAIRDRREEFCELYRQGSTLKEISRLMRCGTSRARERLVFWGVVIRSNQEIGDARAYMPTPEEIRQKTAEIQARWTEKDREERGEVHEELHLPMAIPSRGRHNGDPIYPE